LELLAVQPGKLIANLLAMLLLASLIGGVFLVFGRPLRTERGARMVILLPIDTIATGSVRKACSIHACQSASISSSRPPGRLNCE
jgi:hypothetical protein